MRASVSIDRMLVLAARATLPGSVAFAAPRGTGDDCRLAAPREDRLKTIGPRGEIEFTSGERALLSGIRWPEDDASAREARSWLEGLRERPLAVSVRGEPDRWGRTRIDATTVGDDRRDLAGALISAGLALADVGEAEAFCRGDLLAFEETPRKAGKGVWAMPLRDARDGKGLEAVEGDFVVAQGRILHVGERSRRTYLNFSRRGEPGLSVTVPKRTWRIMQERGLTAATLRGRFVRVRGRVEVWRGPVIEIGNADMIEVLEGQGAADAEASRR